MQTATRRVARAARLVALAALCACGADERRELEASIGTLTRDKQAMSARVDELTKETAKDRELLLAASRRAEDAERRRDEEAKELAAATARAAAEKDEKEAAKKELAAATARADAEKDEKEAAKKDLDEVVAHRDELKEWIEDELLPVAEKSDPRLANLRDTAKEMAEEVEKTRGLKFKEPFMRRLISRAQVGEWMRRDLKKELPEDEARKLTLVGAEVGLLPPKTDLYEIFPLFFEAGALAFYKPETKTFYLIEGNDGRGARPVVFHELVHALEDQYFHLDDFYKAVEHHGDEELARRGLVEGSAVHFAEKYERSHPDDYAAMMKSQATPEMMKKQLAMLNKVPPFLIVTIGLYPYKNAPAWLAKIGADTPEQMAKLYADPPVSTEQVLHPEKFPLDGPRDYPHRIGTPDVASILGDGFEHVDDDEMGELMISMLLAQLEYRVNAFVFLNVVDMKTESLAFKDPVKKAAEGWDGDRYTAWIEKSTGRVCVVWTSVWDGEKDAQEFFDVYGRLLGRRVTGADPKEPPKPLRYADKDGRVSGLDVAGARVVAVLGAPPEKAAALFAAVAAVKVEADPRDPNDSK